MAIQQHPVPQDISNYKFRLIGDMTIKQFAALGISIVLSVMTYSAPLPFFFKYPISFFILLIGVGTAFVPFQGRTLDVWIVAFIKSIYSPTQYVWKHGQENTSVTPIDNSSPQTPVVNITPPASDTPTQTNQTSEPITEPKTSTLNTLPQSVEVDQKQQLQEKNEEIVVENTTTKATPPETPREVINPETIVNIPVSVQTVTATEIKKETTIQKEPEKSTTENTQSLPIPFTPSTPNTLVGLTLTPNGQTLDGVLVEIKNQSITMRATKSNKLGQFLFVRPLENGLYHILAEKEGFQFESYSIQLNGEIINPLRIQAIN